MLFRNKYRIGSARLVGWNYSAPGYYFLTVCTHDRGNLFGEIIGDKMMWNKFGQIVYDEWDKSFEIRRELVRDEFVVMPNHFHGIVRMKHPIPRRNRYYKPGFTTILFTTKTNYSELGNTFVTIRQIGERGELLISA